MFDFHNRTIARKKITPIILTWILFAFLVVFISDTFKVFFYEYIEIVVEVIPNGNFFMSTRVNQFQSLLCYATNLFHYR